MSHPYHHALSSVKKFGGQVDDYLAIHSWLDATKSHFANFRHRALRHNRTAVDTAVAVFDRRGISHNGVLINSDGLDVPVTAVANQHIGEDCGCVPSAMDWVLSVNPGWGRHIDVENHIARDTTRWGGKPDDYRPIHEWFQNPHRCLGHEGLRALRYHSQGIFTAEEVFGVVITNADSWVVPVRLIAEEHVKAEIGRIPTAYDWLSLIQAEPWMRRVRVKLGVR
jgi:hypothetical protein